MDRERERARASWKGGAKESAAPAFRELPRSLFDGYSGTASSGCRVAAIVRGGASVPELKSGEEAEVVLDHTPFYAESGGQVGDVGWFYDRGRNNVLAEVRGCFAPVQGVRAHKVLARQNIRVRDMLDAVVNAAVRTETMRNHTATHLLHAALRETLGKHVKQAGSLVAPNHLRFDFSHFTGVADEELQDIEDLVNREVLRNTRVETMDDVPLDTAINEMKAMALFGEKYGDRVRVIKIGDFSVELCGGTHTAATGEVGLVKILHEGSVSSGVRRVEAITGDASLAEFRKTRQRLTEAAAVLNVGADDAAGAAARLAQQVKQFEKQVEAFKKRAAHSQVDELLAQARTVKNVRALAAQVSGVDRAGMRQMVDSLRQKLGSGVVVLGAVEDGADRVALIAGVTKDLNPRLHAGKIVQALAAQVGGSGGGRPDLAEAGGKDTQNLEKALASLYSFLDQVL